MLRDEKLSTANEAAHYGRYEFLYCYRSFDRAIACPIKSLVIASCPRLSIFVENAVIGALEAQLEVFQCTTHLVGTAEVCHCRGKYNSHRDTVFR